MSENIINQKFDVYASKIPAILEVFHHFNTEFTISSDLVNPSEWGNGENVVCVEYKRDINIIESPVEFIATTMEQVRRLRSDISDMHPDPKIVVGYDLENNTFWVRTVYPDETVTFVDYSDFINTTMRSIINSGIPWCLNESVEWLSFHSQHDAKIFTDCVRSLQSAYNT